MKLLSPVSTLVRRSLLAASLSLASLAHAGTPEGQVAHLDRLVEAEKPGNQFICQNNVDLNPELSYKLTFWAKASSPLVKARISTKVSQAPWKTFGKRDDVDLTTEWAQYEVFISGEGAVPGFTRITVSYADGQPGQLWIADVRMQAESAPETAENLIRNGRFESGLADWYTEGQQPGQFKIDVQTVSEANTPTQ